MGVLLAVALVVIAARAVEDNRRNAYLNGIQDGQTLTNNQIINQLATNGFVTLIINNGNQTRLIKLVPQPQR
jgi:protein-disulfide isomerase-like protein with CxxC motif